MLRRSGRKGNVEVQKENSTHLFTIWPMVSTSVVNHDTFALELLLLLSSVCFLMLTAISDYLQLSFLFCLKFPEHCPVYYNLSLCKN